MVLLAAGGTYAAVKLTQKDAQAIEQQTGASVEDLTEEDLAAAMKELGIKSIELDDNDRAALASETDQATAAPPPAAPEESYVDELERLAGLRDQGIITDEDFEAKKKQLLGL
jgi:NACalpha-BTF3-like transcription factor